MLAAASVIGLKNKVSLTSNAHNYYCLLCIYTENPSFLSKNSEQILPSGQGTLPACQQLLKPLLLWSCGTADFISLKFQQK